MFNAKKCLATAVAAATMSIAVNGITASAYTYASNEVKFYLYTHAPAAAPDIVQLDERMYIPYSSTAVKGYCTGYADTGKTETIIKLSIPSSLASGTHFTTFEDVGQLRSVPMKSNWVSKNGGSCYMTCVVSLVDYNLDKEFTGTLFVY